MTMSEDIKVGDRVRVEGTIPGTPLEANGEGTVIDEATPQSVRVRFDGDVGSSDEWNVYKTQVTKIAADSVTPSAPLAILARAAEEVLTYHIRVEDADWRDVDGVDEALSVGVLRDLVRLGKREGVI